MYRVSFSVTHLSFCIQKYFCILLSVVLIWPQIVEANSVPSDISPTLLVHGIDNYILYRLGQFHEKKRGIEDALNFYELCYDASNHEAFYKLSTQRPRGDDCILIRDYDCLSQLVSLDNIRGSYLMGRLYKNEKRDLHTLRTLRARGVINEKMDDAAAVQYLREQSDHLYRLAAGHRRTSQSIAISLRESREAVHDFFTKRQLLEEELKYWKIAARGVAGTEDEAISKVESAQENIAKIEAYLHQLARPELESRDNL
ncbi:MAG TPA: hypothetical protein DIC42_04700 [Holosporales bacterium]|nr:hypothetical protein [Holosporales bacterium]